MKLVTRKKFLNEKGFTLIEVIATLVILTVMGALVIVSTIRIIEGFTIAKMNAATSQKGHIALSRLTKEFTNITKINSYTSTSIDFKSSNINTQQLPFVNHTVFWDGAKLLLDVNNILVNNVSGFDLALDGNVLVFTLTLTGAKGIPSAFTSSVTPRNL